MNTKLTAHDIFWLARYAHNTLDPLLKSARNYERSLHWIIMLNFSKGSSVYGEDNLSIMAHWDRHGMFIYSPSLRTTAQIDAVATKVRDFIQTEQAAFEAAEDAKAEAATLAELAAAEADADYDDLGYEVSDEDMEDYEAQQERIRERADIERAEHDHDIHLQNEMAGN